MFDALSILVSRLLQQPHGCKCGRGPAAALPTSRYAHLARHKNVMRPTGEASKPDLSISIAVLFGAFVIGFLRRRLTERLGSGVSWQHTRPGRFRNRNVVVSVPHSKRFFAFKASPAFSSGRNAALS
jgi:hypothetical protein